MVLIFLALGLRPEAGLAAPANSLRIAVIPIIDTLPIYVAQSEGLFGKYGLEVNVIPVASAPERDQLLQAGQADGTVNELLSVIFFNRNQVRLQAVRFGLMASKGMGHFFLLVSPGSGIQRAQDLKGAEIGISKGTIIEYITDRLLTAQGLDPKDVHYVSIPKIADRMALLSSGKLKAAVMPDPLAGLAVQQGAKVLLNDASLPRAGASVISFLKDVTDQYPQAVQAFLKAWEEAVGKINRMPTQYQGLLVEKKLVPPSLIKAYRIPPFPTAGVPSPVDWQEVLQWAKAKGLVSGELPYKDSVNPRFLP